MKRIVACLLIAALAVPITLVADDTADTKSNAESYNEGIIAAEREHTTLGWGVGSFFAGGIFSWLGTGVTVLIASGSRPTPSYIPEDVEPMSYRSGYTEEARRRNLRSSAIPGVIMSTIWTVLVLSAMSAQ
jgi:hypothetical protein